jgi:ATP-dependent DNA ligase
MPRLRTVHCARPRTKRSWTSGLTTLLARGFTHFTSSTTHTRRAPLCRPRNNNISGLTAEDMKRCRWLKPQLVAVIEFLEWTADRHLRHPKFVALRDDKDPKDVRQETEA